MMRDGYHEPERVFPPPPTPILDGPLEDRALEILELIVGIYRVSTDDIVMGRGVSWPTVQRWYSVGGSRERGIEYMPRCLISLPKGTCARIGRS
jgi:hypothetical protein